MRNENTTIFDHTLENLHLEFKEMISKTNIYIEVFVTFLSYNQKIRKPLIPTNSMRIAATPRTKILDN